MSKVLRERRLALGKGLDEVAGATRIGGACLRAIEEEDFRKLPVEVYTRGYIKEYARYLDVPADIALEAYEKYLGGSAALSRGAVQRPDFLTAGNVGKDLNKKRPYVKLLYMFLLVLIIAAGIVLYIFPSEKAAYIRKGRQTSTLVSPKPQPASLTSTHAAPNDDLKAGESSGGARRQKRRTGPENSGHKDSYVQEQAAGPSQKHVQQDQPEDESNPGDIAEQAPDKQPDGQSHATPAPSIPSDN